MTNKKSLTLETLERRNLFATFNVPWPEVDHLSLSFIEDGTEIGNDSSELYRTLDRVFSDRDWKIEVLRAFQTWAIETKANIALVKDGGQPVGTIGFKQGDVRFGDVRIGAFPMETDVLAVANPYDAFIANTWVGDIFLNGNSRFLQSSEDPKQALYEIMLHESGHVFGIGHSLDPASPMYPQFQSISNRLTPSDIAAIRSLYGGRQADPWEGDTGNQTNAQATYVAFNSNDGRAIAPSWHADIQTTGDIDTYSFQIPPNTRILDIELQAKGISLLTAKLSVIDSLGVLVGYARADDPRSNDLSLTLDKVVPGETLYLRVEASKDDVFGVGSYQINLLPRLYEEDPGPPAPIPEFEQPPEDGTQEFLATTPGYVEHTYYEVEGTLTTSRPVRTYRVRSAEVSPKLANIFTVVVGTKNISIDSVNVAISDLNGQDVPFEVIPNDQGAIALQVTGVASAVDYLIEISSKEAVTQTIHYEVEVDFAHDGRNLQTIVNESLDDAQPVYEHIFRVEQSQQMHFALAASDWSHPAESGLEMQLVDSRGEIILVVQVRDGATQTFDAFLDKGEYSFRFSSPGRDHSVHIIFQLASLTTSSPIGPQLRDTVREPVGSEAATPFHALTNYWLPGFTWSSSNLASVTTNVNRPSSKIDGQPSLAMNSLPHHSIISIIGGTSFDSDEAVSKVSSRLAPPKASNANNRRSASSDAEQVEKAAYHEPRSKENQTQPSEKALAPSKTSEVAPASNVEQDTPAAQQPPPVDKPSTIPPSVFHLPFDHPNLRMLSLLSAVLFGMVQYRKRKPTVPPRHNVRLTL